ncbi:P-loop containing nucleoside triphosphate hydrolase protein [Peziza echinospora]|nr:P-loop containing nucleoside triphosphate hydrolase protein [Peziza echinospora]
MQIPTASINDRNPTPSPSPALSPSPTPPPQEPSGLDTLNGGMRKMVDMVNKLRAAGIEGLGLGLPRIAVVGNQSAGKSSLIEAISGIKVPRYTGTCTRCPLEINLSDATPTPSSRSPADPTSPSPSWHCKISLRFNKQYNPSCGGLGRGNNPWVDQPIQQHLFMEVTNKDDVERALVKAQRAILNPSRSWQEFVNGGGGGRKEEEDFEVKFSPNVVCMEISGRGLPNLAFIDLPGVIQTTEAESEDYLIDLVTGLVKEYVREKDCLILLAMTMRDDAVNQSAARLAREMGEERTIGALTKPDTVCPGEFKQWIEILRGKAHRLKHGYFVTKQPSQDQLLKGITHAEARKAEDQFFATTEPWATELQDMTERFGTVALTRYLAAELGERIRLRLPGIVETIKCQADDVQHELDSFPAPAIDNHFFVIQNLLTKFGLAVEEYIQGGGGGDRNKLQTGLKAFARELGKVIDAGRPRIHWAQTEEEELAAPPPLPQNFTANRGNRDGGRGLDVISVESGDSKQPRKRNRNNTSPAGEPPSSTFTLMQLNRISEAHSNGQIPDQVSSKAIEFLARQTLLGWRPCIFRYLDDCQRLLISILSELFHRKFECYQKTPLFAKSHEIIDRYLETAFRTQTKTTISRIYRLEQEQIATADEKTFKAAKARHLDRLLEARQRNKEEQREAKRRRLNLDTLPLRKRQHEEKKLLQDEEKDSNGRTYDRFAIEIELMAGTRAYYDLASRRFVDNVFMSVLGEWIAGVKEGLQEELWTGLGFGEGDVHEKAKSLLEEDPEKERRRRELEIKGEKLRRAMEELNRL